MRAARARVYTRGRARRTNVRATTFLSRYASSVLLADMSADEPFAPESSRRRRDPARTTRRLSASTSAAAYAARAFLVAAAAVSAGAQSLSAQGGMYYPYGSAVGPLYGYARRPHKASLFLAGGFEQFLVADRFLPGLLWGGPDNPTAVQAQAPRLTAGPHQD